MLLALWDKNKYWFFEVSFIVQTKTYIFARTIKMYRSADNTHSFALVWTRNTYLDMAADLADHRSQSNAVTLYGIKCQLSSPRDLLRV